MLVIDASSAVSLVLPDEKNFRAEALLNRLQEKEGLAPALMLLEASNGLIFAEKRHRLTEADLFQALKMIKELPIQLVNLETQGPIEAIIGLAREHSLTIYDATYLDLALRENANLATQDKALATAAKKAGIKVL